jgi:hypothetical protein
MTKAHPAFRWSSITAKDGKRFMVIGDALCHPDNVTDAHKQALDNPRPADT